jgi:ABC-type transport system involved in cytochrome bd biosynthesis fused ATPase/permease subunit
MYDETTNLPLMINENNKNEVMIGETPTQNHNNINIENSNFESKQFEKKPFGIFVKNATAKWTENLSDNTLSHVDLEVTPGKLVAVIGEVGSGKVNKFSCKLMSNIPVRE